MAVAVIEAHQRSAGQRHVAGAAGPAWTVVVVGRGHGAVLCRDVI